jgi:AcrR family transcriptional regulator
MGLWHARLPRRILARAIMASVSFGRPAADGTPRYVVNYRDPEGTHAKIERAAFRLFSERDFAGTTLDDIAAEVGVGRRTVTRYSGRRTTSFGGSSQTR